MGKLKALLLTFIIVRDGYKGSSRRDYLKRLQRKNSSLFKVLQQIKTQAELRCT